MIEMELKGIEPLDHALRMYPLKIQKKVLSQAANAGASLVKKEIKRNIKAKGLIETKALYRSIISRKTKGRSQAFPMYKVGPAESVFYAKFLEFGWQTVAPSLRPVPANPFVRPAFDNNKANIIKAISNKLALTMEKEAAKLGAQSVRK